MPPRLRAYAHAQVSFPESRDSVGASCFTVFGFDVMLDAEANVWLIETNELPSFDTDSPLDLDIKMSVVKEALAMVVHVRASACVLVHIWMRILVRSARAPKITHAHMHRFVQTPRKLDT
jgi:hypothetical protein